MNPGSLNNPFPLLQERLRRKFKRPRPVNIFGEFAHLITPIDPSLVTLPPFQFPFAESIKTQLNSVNYRHCSQRQWTRLCLSEAFKRVNPLKEKKMPFILNGLRLLRT